MKDVNLFAQEIEHGERKIYQVDLRGSYIRFSNPLIIYIEQTKEPGVFSIKSSEFDIEFTGKRLNDLRASFDEKIINSYIDYLQVDWMYDKGPWSNVVIAETNIQI